MHATGMPFHHQAATLLLSALCLAPCRGGEPDSTFDRIWSRASLYENPGNPYLRSFALSGRLQADAAFFGSNQGNYERLTWRRFRFGFKSGVFQDLTIHAEADIDLNRLTNDPARDSYNRLTDASITWSRDDSFALKLGKQSAGFTLDGITSSKKLLTPERSTVGTNLWFPTEYFTGISGSGKVDCWAYQLGVFSSSGDEQFGSFDSGNFGLISGTRDFSSATSLEHASARLDYVYNNPDYSGNVGTRDLRHIVSLSSKLRQDRLGLWSDLAIGKGTRGQSNLFGLQIMPWYDLTDQWQLVFRYSFVGSSDDNGVRLNRYESRIESGKSDRAHECFLGLNWFIHEHKLKWQNGVEYTSTGDKADDGGKYNGWGFTSAMRVYW